MRYDLPLPQQLVQIAHAGIESGQYFGPPPEQPDNVVLIGLANEAALRAAHEHLTSLGIAHRVIDEPDIGNQITAISTAPLTGEIRKALRQYECWTTSRWERSNRVSTANLVGSGVQSPLLAPCAGSSVGRAPVEAERRKQGVGGSSPSPRTTSQAPVAQRQSGEF